MPWDFVDDAVSTVGGAVGGGIDAIDGLGGGILSGGGGLLGGVGGTVGALLSGDPVGSFEGVWGGVTDTLGGAGSVIGGLHGGAFSFLDDTTGGALGGVTGLLDGYVTEPVQFATLGAVDVDLAGGNLAANVNLGPVGGAGVTLGEHGVSADAGALGQEAGVGLTDQGFHVDATAGLDYGPLPYASGHVDVGADGTVSVAGEAQATIPTPYGLLSAHGQGGFVQTADGEWGAFVAADGTLHTPVGVTLAAGAQAAYAHTDDGSDFSIAGQGSVGYLGAAAVGGSAGYSTEDGFASDADLMVDLGEESLLEAGRVALTAAGIAVPDSLDGVVAELVQLEADDLAQLVDGLDSAAASELLVAAAGTGTLEELLGHLDTRSAAGLISQLAAPAAGPPHGALVADGSDAVTDPVTLTHVGESGGEGLPQALDAADAFEETVVDDLFDGLE